ncbi:MAG: aromatic ring-hydroxylating dioxygenase subunit alpha [Rhodospirillales bacterium]|nr:aromatic ring-hydroxylating dioxygenase subunit alpha [Rhodospirillales bacterium]
MSTTLANVMRPIEEWASGLPNEAYVSDAFAEWEQGVLLARTWACIGTGRRVPEVGDAMPLEFAGLPLFMLRGRDGEVRVFHNVCSHRGMMLMEEPTRTRGAIRCPYHSWTYELDGSLRSTPMIGGTDKNTCPGFDPEKYGLKPVRTATWFDAIFVNLSGDAPPFESFIAPVAERWKDFDAATLHHESHDSSYTLDVACNWKLAVENFCEAYHLPWIHPNLNSYSRLEDHYQIAEEEDGYAGQGSTAYQPQLVENGEAFPTMPNLPTPWHGTAEYVALFPTALFGVHADHFYTVTLEPKGPGRTIERMDIYYFADEALDEAHTELRRANARLWQGIFEEDRFVVEGMQRGRASPAYKGGVLSPALERTTHCFYRWVARKMLEANGVACAA